MYFDAHCRQRPENKVLKVGDLALVYNAQLPKHWCNKLANRSKGLYRILVLAPRDSVSIVELNRTTLLQEEHNILFRSRW